MTRLRSASCALLVALLLALPLLPPAAPAAPRAPGDPAVTSAGTHNRSAAWNFSDLAGYGAVNLTVSGGGAALAADAGNSSAAAEWTVQTNSAATASAAMNSRDRVVVAWYDFRNGNDYNSYARIYDAAGAQMGSEIAVAVVDGYDESYPAVAVDSKDNIIVAWTDSRNGWSDIYAKIYNSTGAQVGGEFVICNASAGQWNPDVAVGPDDRFIVAWTDGRAGNSNPNIYARFFNSTGAPVSSEFAVTEAPWLQYSASIAAAPNGNFMVAWTDNRSGSSSNYDAYARIFNSTGVPVSSEINVSNGPVTEMLPSVAVDSKGDFLVAWQDRRNGPEYDIYAKVFNSTGAQSGSEFVASNATGDQQWSFSAVDSRDNFLVAWADRRGGSSYDIYAAQFNSTGTRFGGEVAVTNLTGDQLVPILAVDSKGGFAVVWRDSSTYSVSVRWFYHPYHTNGYLATPDFTPPDLYRWENISASFHLQNGSANSVAQSYSTDGGISWTGVSANGSLASVPAAAGRIRFRMALATADRQTTPLLYGLALNYSVNKRPIFDSFPADAAAPKNRPLNLAAVVSDGDNDSLSYGWNLTGGPGATLANTTGPSATFTAAKSGAWTVRLAVNDSFRVVARTVNLTVVNHPPAITGPSSYVQYKKTATPIPVNASDEDNDTLVFEWKMAGINPGVTLSDTAALSPLVTAAAPGDIALRLAVGDGEANTSVLFNITVVGRPPVANLSANATSVRTGEAILFDGSASTDPDGDALQYRFTFGDGNSTGWLTGAATAVYSYGSAGDYSALVEARDTDGNSSSSEPLTVTVVPRAVPPSNLPPMAAFTFNMTVPSDPLNSTFTSVSTDPDGAIVKSEWDFGDGTTGIGAVVSHLFPRAGNYTVVLTVTDNNGSANSTSRIVSAGAPGEGANRPPEIKGSAPAGSPSFASGGEQEFTVTASDADSDALTYSWTLNGTPIPGAAAPAYRFVPGGAGTYVLRVSVTDGKSPVVTREWSVTVTAGEKTPTTTAPAPFPYLYLIMGVVAALAAAAGGYAMWRRSRRRTPETQPVPASPATPTPPQAAPEQPSAAPVGFAIEDVFLMYRDGRLIHHATRRIKADMDVDIMTSMLSAVQAFVKDSLGAAEGSELGAMEYGENKILLQKGKSVVLAAVISGGEPVAFRDEMKAAINNIEGEFGAVLPGWDGTLSQLAGAKRFLEHLGAYRPAEAAAPERREKADVAVAGELEFYQGFVRLKVAMKNNMSTLVADAAFNLIHNKDALRLERIEPVFQMDGPNVTMGNIGPREKKTVAFYLDPQICTETYIEGVLTYKDAHGTLETVKMPRKLASVVCPIMYTDENINTAMLKRLVAEELDKRDSKLFSIPAGISPERAFELGKASVQHHDARLVREFTEKTPFVGESWYYGKAKGREDRMVIRARVIAERNILEFFAASSSTLLLTGLLAELKSDLKKELDAARVGGGMEQVTDAGRMEVVAGIRTLLDISAEAEPGDTGQEQRV